MSTVTETPQEALARIHSMGFGKNDAVAIMAFAECGIDPEEIEPRQNVLTFNAWKGAGRRVAKGAMSVKVTVWVPKSGKDGDEKPAKEGEKKKRGGMYPKTTCLFHVSQTVPQDATKGTRPEAWQNPKLVREGTYEAPGPVSVVDQLEARSRKYDGDYIPDEGPLTEDQQTRRFNSLQRVMDDIESGDLPIPENPHDSEEEPAGCNCPMVGVITNVDCPIHGKGLVTL
jgi:hypothetical protein